MNLYRKIVSLVLLSAYALLLLHDFIPHTHQAPETTAQTNPEIHAHNGIHHHHDHGHDKRDDTTSKLAEEQSAHEGVTQLPDESTFQHQHDLVCRTAAKDKLIPQNPPDLHSVAETLEFRVKPNLIVGFHPDFVSSHSPPLLSSCHGLRAPPTLG